MSKCCGCNKKVLSNAVANNTDSCTCSLTDNCTDVCVTPQCGDPKLLTVLVPVIYDEIGINVCRTIPLATLLADYPTAAYIRAEVTNITFATGAAPSVTIKPIAGRPNCYELTLTNLTVDFVIYVYDCCKRLLATLPVTGVVYLPSATTDPEYDEDTNFRNDAVVRTIWSHLHGYDCSNTKPELYRIPLHERNGFAGTESDGNVQSIKLRYCKCGNDGRTYPDREIHLLQPIPDPSQRKSARIQGHACKSGGVCLHELCKRKPLRPEHQAIGALQSA